MSCHRCSVPVRPPFQDPNGGRYPQERKQVGREAAEHRDRGLSRVCPRSRLTRLQEVLNKAVVELGDLRASMEEVKWDNMRNAVGDYRPSSFAPLPHLPLSRARRLSCSHRPLHGNVRVQQTKVHTDPPLRSRR